MSGQAGAGAPGKRFTAVFLPFARVMVAAALAVVLFFAYAASLGGAFVLDDDQSVTVNASIRQLSAIGKVLTPPETSPVGGRPLANASFALNYALGGTHPRGYRVANLLVHLGTALCLFGLVRRTRQMRVDPDAFIVAVSVAFTWALHPVLSEAVAYVAQRTELLMGFFYLATLYAFSRGATTSSRAWLGVSLLTCALGMACKEVMVTAPAAVLLYDRIFVSGSFRAAWRARARYYAALAATWLLLAWLMSGGIGRRSVGFGLGVSWWQYALTESKAVWIYLHTALWPHPLVFDYGAGFVTGVRTVVPFILGVGAVLGVVAVCVRRAPALGFWAALFFIVLAPTSSVVPLAQQPIADSRLYLPLAFGTAFAVMALHRAIGRRGVGMVVAASLAFAVSTRARCGTLASPERLWRDTLAKRPGNARAHSNYGAVLFAAGQIDAAIAHEREALRLDPSLAQAEANLAAALLRKGNAEEAIVRGRRALELSPEIPDANYVIGNALGHVGRVAEAIPYYEAEIRLRPDWPYAYTNLGVAHYLLGHSALAIECLETALRLPPGDEDARERLATALVQAGRREEAIAVYRECLRRRPGVVSTLSNLGIVLAQLGRLDEAETEFRAALARQPDYAPARAGLAELQELQRRRPKP